MRSVTQTVGSRQWTAHGKFVLNLVTGERRFARDEPTARRCANYLNGNLPAEAIAIAIAADAVLRDLIGGAE